MFDIGFWELVLCAVVALVVLGPERMPQAVRTGLIWWRAARQTLQQVRSTLEHEISQMEQIVKPTETTSGTPPQASSTSNASTPMPQATPDHPAPAAMPSDLSEAIEALKAASPVSSEATDQAAAAAWPPSAQAIPSAQAMPSGASPSTARAAIMPEVTDAQPVNVPPPSTGPAAPAAEVAAAIAALKAASPVQTAAPTTPRGDQP